MEQDRFQYHRQKAIDAQKSVVTYKSSSTLTSEAFIWTYRTTSCDVISIITTTLPIKDGLMKDIQLENREIRRLKPALLKKNGKPFMKGSPFEAEFALDMETNKKKLNKLLLSEKKSFMAKLNISRFLRSKVENDAATKLQAIYRGHYTRISMLDIEQNALVNRKIRSNIRSFLANKYKMKLSLSSYKQTREVIRNKSAALIQSLFMRYLSRKCLRRRRYEWHLARRLKAATSIQAAVRGSSARARVKLLVERIQMVMAIKAALKIQTLYRGLMARRRVRRRRIKLRLLAGRAIQNWFRAKYTRQMAAHIKQMMHFKRTNKGALLMQLAVRRFVAHRRTDRIRLRRLHQMVFRCVTAIQRLIRRFLAKIFVNRRRAMFKDSQAALERLAAVQAQEEEERRTEQENRALLESVDIFLQASRGRTSEVEDIFKGLVSTESHTAADQDGNGDTLLTIAAATGNTDLLRKCLQWGFDVNHRNDEGKDLETGSGGLNALMLTVKHNHFQTMQYLLTPPSEEEQLQRASSLDVISQSDMGYLLATATANVATSNDLSMLTALLALELDVNAKHPVTGMTAMHAACEIGHLDAFKLLMKYKASLEGTDEQGQTPLHKASSSSLKIAQLILGLDPNFNTYMSELARAVSIVSVDIDGKDCVLLAALAGQTDLMDLYETTLKAGPGNKSSKKPSMSLTGSVRLSGGEEELGWTPEDVVKALRLVESGNLICLQKIFDIGFDPSWPDAETETTLAIAASKKGDLDVLDILMAHGADFSMADASGRTPVHYAALNPDSSVLVHLLTHAKASSCKLSDQSLTVCDSNGENAFHLAAREGRMLNVDLLAQKATEQALQTRNKIGFTPLLLACSYGHEKLIHTYIKLGANVHVVDNLERGCLWHLFHPTTSIAVPADERARRPFGSEFNSQSNLPSTMKAYSSSSRKDKDDDVARLSADLSVLGTLLKAGCSLYSDHGQLAEDMLSLPHNPEEPPSPTQQVSLQCGDVAVQELSVSFLKSAVMAGLSQLDAWRLLLSSIRFDDGSLKVFMLLLRSGIIDLLTEDAGAEVESVAAPAEEGSVSGSVAISESGLSAKQSFAKSRATSVPHLEVLLGKQQAANGTDSYQVSRLQDVYFLDLNLVGWAIKLGNIKALQVLVRKGYDTSLPVDTVDHNSCLHFVARHGTPDMVDVAMTDRRTRLEQTNAHNFTAGMVAAQCGHIKIAKRLFEYKANPRRSLDGKYAAWVLAHVRRKEKNEVNLQTGRVGDDDVQYFDITPEPFYTTWYSSAL